MGEFSHHYRLYSGGPARCLFGESAEVTFCLTTPRFHFLNRQWLAALPWRAYAPASGVARNEAEPQRTRSPFSSSFLLDMEGGLHRRFGPVPGAYSGNLTFGSYHGSRFRGRPQSRRRGPFLLFTGNPHHWSGGPARSATAYRSASLCTATCDDGHGIGRSRGLLSTRFLLKYFETRRLNPFSY